jgi:alkanesulfonate monooxygenase SsuD/methylene tetrahydromethanopterin reductase-like flavin-dependent oxidoreductase (luciferase family)
MVLDCWTKESVELRGKHYQAPYPIETGVQGYVGAGIAREAGAPGEIDEAGNVRRVCVVPRPFQKPHPPVFMSVNKSRETIAFAAKHAFRPCYFSPGDSVVELAKVYAEEAARFGHDFQLGERQNVVRQMRIARSSEELERRVKAYDVDIFKNFYSHFGIHHVDPSEADDDYAFRSMMSSGFLVGGTVDDTIRYWRNLYARMPFEYITLIWHFAQQPKDLVLEELQLFMEKVRPELETPEFASSAS